MRQFNKPMIQDMLGFESSGGADARKGEIYYVGAYIPTDENIVRTTIYKLCELGNRGKIFTWIGINVGGRDIGSATDHYGNPTEADAFIRLFSVISRDVLKKAFRAYHLSDVLNVEKSFIETLSRDLDKTSQPK